MFKKIKNIGFKINLLLLLPFFFFNVAKGESEYWYQKVWCEGRGGKVEYRIDNGKRVDCLTEKYAIEMDFAHKWYEAVGQSLYYAIKTKKKAGIVLIVRTTSDLKNWQRLQQLIEYYQLPIKSWKLGP